MADLTENGSRHSILRLWTAIAVWMTIAIFAGHACTHMVAAGDTWVAMACARLTRLPANYKESTSEFDSTVESIRNLVDEDK